METFFAVQKNFYLQDTKNLAHTWRATPCAWQRAEKKNTLIGDAARLVLSQWEIKKHKDPKFFEKIIQSIFSAQKSFQALIFVL